MRRDTMSDATAVVDDAEHHRFLYTEDDVNAELVYRVIGKRLILVHAEVRRPRRTRHRRSALPLHRGASEDVR